MRKKTYTDATIDSPQDNGVPTGRRLAMGKMTATSTATTSNDATNATTWVGTSVGNKTSVPPGGPVPCSARHVRGGAEVGFSPPLAPEAHPEERPSRAARGGATRRNGRGPAASRAAR